MSELVDDDSTQNPIAPPSPVSSNIDGSSVEPVNVNNVQAFDSTYGGKDAGAADNNVVAPISGGDRSLQPSIHPEYSSNDYPKSFEPLHNGNDLTGGGAPPAGGAMPIPTPNTVTFTAQIDTLNGAQTITPYPTAYIPVGVAGIVTNFVVEYISAFNTPGATECDAFLSDDNSNLFSELSFLAGTTPNTSQSDAVGNQQAYSEEMSTNNLHIALSNNLPSDGKTYSFAFTITYKPG